MSTLISFVFDFDSTFIRGEMLEYLADLALQGSPSREATLHEIGELTRRAMEGDMDYGDSLRARLKLVPGRREFLEKLVAKVRENITPSFKRNQTFFKEHAEDIYIVSSGFREVLVPIAEEFGLAASHVFGNDLIFDADGRLEGVNPDNPLARAGGKVDVVRSLKLPGQVCMVGDGMSDYAVREAGLESTQAAVSSCFSPTRAPCMRMITPTAGNKLAKML